MKKLHILAISLASLLTSNVSNAFVYKMELWKDGKDNTVITLSDYHLDTFSLITTRTQKPAIIDLASKLNAYCIFEDSMSYAGTCPEVKEQNQEVNSLYTKLIESSSLELLCREVNLDSYKENEIRMASPLYNITADARESGVECESIEFRQEWCALLGNKKAPTFNVCTELNYKLDEIIEKYKLDKVLQKIYSKYSSLDDIPLNIKFTSTEPETEKKGNELDDRLSHLLDLEIIFALYKKLQEGKKMFIIYAGGAHIDHITTYGLKEMGFKQKAYISKPKPAYLTKAKQIINNALDITKTYDELNSNQLSQYTSCVIQ